MGPTERWESVRPTGNKFQIGQTTCKLCTLRTLTDTRICAKTVTTPCWIPEEEPKLLDKNRREFMKIGSAALATTAVSWNATSYAAIVGANDRVRVGVVGCGDRMKQALIPSFQVHQNEMNFEFVATSSLSNRPPDQ